MTSTQLSDTLLSQNHSVWPGRSFVGSLLGGALTGSGRRDTSGEWCMSKPCLQRHRWFALLLIFAFYSVSITLMAVPTSPLARGNAYANAERACLETTADRLRIHRADVSIAGTEDISIRGDRLEVHWHSEAGAAGICVCIGSRVVSWEQREGAQAGGQSSTPELEPDSACAAAVATRIRKRTADVDIEEVEVRHRDRALVHWVSYQGERGTCLVENGQVKRIEIE